MKIRILNIIFDIELEAFEIPAFRGAIINKVGQKDTILFHNHIDDKKYVYSYPLIQYKRFGQKAAIVCIGNGVDEIHRFFETTDWNLQIGEKNYTAKIEHLNLNSFYMNVRDKKFAYSIHNWIALNAKNYDQYRQIDSIAEQTLFLEKKLIGNILSFAKGIAWTVEKDIHLKITQINDIRPLSLKGKKLLGFNIEFKTNVFLPNYIGLGKSVSLGYGVIRERKYKKTK